MRLHVTRQRIVYCMLIPFAESTRGYLMLYLLTKWGDHTPLVYTIPCSEPIEDSLDSYEPRNALRNSMSIGRSGQGEAGNDGKWVEEKQRYTALTPTPTLPVSKHSTSPAPTHSSSIHSNLRP